MRDCILLRDTTHVLKTLVSDYVVTEDIYVLRELWLEVCTEFLDILLEVLVDIILKTTDTIVVLDKATTCCLLHAVEHVLTVTHTVKECCESTEVLSITAEIEKMTVNTLELIHDCTDNLDTVREFYTKCLLDNATDSVTVNHCREVVQTVCHCQSLWVCHALEHLLDTTVDISEMWNDTLYRLTIENSLKTKHTVCRWVLRTDIDYELIIAEELNLLLNEVSVLVETILHGIVRLFIVLKCITLLGNKVLTERISLEVVTKEEATHIRMTEELDSEEIKHLTLEQVSTLIEGSDTPDYIRVTLLLCYCLYRDTLMSVSILKDIDTSETFLSKVLTNDSNEIIEMLLVMELCHCRGKLAERIYYVIKFHSVYPP